MRLSGHETFTCRFAWLPKVVKEISQGGDEGRLLFKDEDRAMVRLGVGKNMVRSIRFWAEVSGLIEQSAEGGHILTTFGERLLGRDGLDPFLERQETLWLIHWKISTGRPPVFYWNQMLNFWHRPEFSVSEVIPVLEQALPPNSKSSPRTLGDGFKVFIRTYVPTRGAKGVVLEDNLDCPLIDLGFIRATGERSDVINGKPEPIYTFNYDDKSDVTDSLFAYCLNDFWRNSIHLGDTLSFRYISTAENSPGQIFKLPELSIRSRLERLSNATDGALEFLESNTIQQVVRNSEIDEITALDNIYFSHL